MISWVVSWLSCVGGGGKERHGGLQWCSVRFHHHYFFGSGNVLVTLLALRYAAFAYSPVRPSLQAVPEGPTLAALTHQHWAAVLIFTCDAHREHVLTLRRIVTALFRQP